MPAVVPVAVSVCAMPVPVPALAPDTPDCTTVHPYVVPATLLLSDTDDAVPEQIVSDAGVVVTTGVGFTVTTTVIGVPEHPLAVGVIV